MSARTADITLEKQRYKPPDLENNPLPQSTDWQSKFREGKKPRINTNAKLSYGYDYNRTTT